MNYRIVIFLILILFAVACSKKVDTATEQPNQPKVSPAEAMKKVEEVYPQRNDVAKLRELIQILSLARNPEQRNFEIEWNYSMFNYYLGKLVRDEKEADKIFQAGYSAGTIASNIEPEKADGYFWAAANLGEQAKRSPITVGLKSKKDIAALLSKVVEIEPKYKGASAFVGLAQIELAGMLGGGKPEKAVEYLEKALTLEKENGYIYLALAEAYLAVQRPVDAKKQLDYVVKMKPHPNYLIEHQEVLEKAKKMLDTKF